MNDPLSRAAAHAPRMLGEGCTRRYDPQALSEEDGTEFAEAAALWQQLQSMSEPTPATPDKGAAGEA